MNIFNGFKYFNDLCKFTYFFSLSFPCIYSALSLWKQPFLVFMFFCCSTTSITHKFLCRHRVRGNADIQPRLPFLHSHAVVLVWMDEWMDGCFSLNEFSSSKALCNEDANGNVPLGKSCNRYWQCQGGYPRLQRCPAMLVFDRHSLRCVVPPTEECDIPTTPTPFDGDGENNNVSGGGQLAKDEQERKVSLFIFRISIWKEKKKTNKTISIYMAL